MINIEKEKDFKEVDETNIESMKSITLTPYPLQHTYLKPL